MIFNRCSSNILQQADVTSHCDGSRFIGNTPRSILTKGTSTRRKSRLPGKFFLRKFDPGNNGKLMTTYRREPSHNYTFDGTCGVLYQEDMHFFGGINDNLNDLSRQHFVVEKHRSGERLKRVRMQKLENLNTGLMDPMCSTFQLKYEEKSENVVILCSSQNYQRSCFVFDNVNLTYIGDSKFKHFMGGLTAYRNKEGFQIDSRWVALSANHSAASNYQFETPSKLLAVGGLNTQKTEIIKRNKYGFLWSTSNPDFNFVPGRYIIHHSLVTFESADSNKEYVLLIGGLSDDYVPLKKVFKFDGEWHQFGELKKPRSMHSSIYWNGMVYVIGGNPRYMLPYNRDFRVNGTKTEIWNIKDSPGEFKTTDNFPELLDWIRPHLFVIPDSFFPDH